MASPSWEDFLNNFDKAQEDVVTPWGKSTADPYATAGKAKTDYKKRRAANEDKFHAGGTAAKPKPSSNLDSKTEAKIKMLEAQLEAPGRTEAERQSARNIIAKLKGG